MSCATPMSSDSEFRYSGTRMRPARSSHSSPARQARKAQAASRSQPESDFCDGAAFSCTVADHCGDKRASSWPASTLSALKLPSSSIQRR